MPTLVEKLQLDAMDPKVPVSDLLRRVKFTAVKLGLGNVEDWVEQELNGYDVVPPAYRVLHGRPMSQHPYRGWEEIGGDTEMLSKRGNNQAIASLESMVALAGPGTEMHIPFPDIIAANLNKANRTVGWNCALVVSPSELVRVLDKVRNLVLDWALNLEKAGIMGGEADFNETEKGKAQAASTTINIGSIGAFAGNIGAGNSSGANSVKLRQTHSLLNQLKPHMSALVAAGADKKILEERISALEKEIKSPTPDEAMIRGYLTDLRTTLTGAAGNLIATGAMAALNVILGTGVPG